MAATESDAWWRPKRCVALPLAATILPRLADTNKMVLHSIVDAIPKIKKEKKTFHLKIYFHQMQQKKKSHIHDHALKCEKSNFISILQVFLSLKFLEKTKFTFFFSFFLFKPDSLKSILTHFYPDSFKFFS